MKISATKRSTTLAGIAQALTGFLLLLSMAATIALWLWVPYLDQPVAYAEPERSSAELRKAMRHHGVMWG